MTQENIDETKTRAAEQLSMPDTQERLAHAFHKIESQYGELREGGEITIAALNPPAITPSGIYIEAVMISGPVPQLDADSSSWAAYHASRKLIVSILDITQEDFDVRPMVVDMVDNANVRTYRGYDFDVLLPYDLENDLEPPEETEDERKDRDRRNKRLYSERLSKEQQAARFELSPREVWVKRNTLKLSKPIKGEPTRHVEYRGEMAIPFRELREKLGIALPST